MSRCPDDAFFPVMQSNLTSTVETLQSLLDSANTRQFTEHFLFPYKNQVITSNNILIFVLLRVAEPYCTERYSILVIPET